MDPRLEIKIDDFNAAMIEMQRRLGNAVPKKRVIDFEVGRILDKALAGTDTATKASINDSIKRTEWTTVEGKKYRLTNRFPDRVWAKIKAQQAASLARKVAAIGWARKSWYALGLRIGQPINARGSENATVQGRQALDNTAIKRDESDGDYTLKIENNSPLMRWTNGRRAFFAAVAGRVGFFRRNVANAVFDDLKAVERKYPGLQIMPPPNT